MKHFFFSFVFHCENSFSFYFLIPHRQLGQTSNRLKSIQLNRSTVMKKKNSSSFSFEIFREFQFTDPRQLFNKIIYITLFNEFRTLLVNIWTQRGLIIFHFQIMKISCFLLLLFRSTISHSFPWLIKTWLKLVLKRSVHVVECNRQSQVKSSEMKIFFS